MRDDLGPVPGEKLLDIGPTGNGAKRMFDPLTIDHDGDLANVSRALRSRGVSSLSFDDCIIRAFDITIAVLAIVFTAPLLVAIFLAIKFSDGGPAFFSQERLGRSGQIFKCLKFRSMILNADEHLARLIASDPVARAEWESDHKLRIDPRITPVGEFLRRSSLDELPQLFNVLLGEMSIVGPRPIVAAEIERYGRRFDIYCTVRPGITGLWQVSGRNDVSYRRRVAMDTLYARRKSLLFDLKILIMTVPAVFFARGSY